MFASDLKLVKGDVAARGAKRNRLARRSRLERFRAKWTPVRVKKTRQNKKLEPVPIQSERKRL
jgi:hypothetical protein